MPKPATSKNQVSTLCVLMTGPDEQMDHRGGTYEPVNALPAKCQHCTFPDLDFVVSPYVLSKGTASPAETAPAHFGNFLVRERARRILEVVVPGACSFHPTIERKSQKPAPWWLAVPQSKLAITYPKPTPPFCSKCHEPKVWDCLMGLVWEPMRSFDSGGVDVFKNAEWYSREVVEDWVIRANQYRRQAGEPLISWAERGLTPPEHEERWTRQMIQRDLYFSLRLELLLKRAKVRGQLVRMLYFKESRPTPQDEAWIEEKLRLLGDAGLTEPSKPSAKPGEGKLSWFTRFLKRKAKAKPKMFDFAVIEASQKIKLPQTYKDFIANVGPMAFRDVMETEGFTARILPPTKLDFKNYRRGRVPDLDEEQSQIDGVMFAETEHGDAFVFDVSATGGDYPVYWHDHEQNTLEPFAANFAECVQRFAEKN